MKRFFEVFIVGTFVSVVAAIIFVKAGKTGTSGGVQASQIISASGSSYAQGISALEGG